MRRRIRSVPAVAAAVCLGLGLSACTSQDDDVSLPVDVSTARGGIFEVSLRRNDGTGNPDPWIFMFSGLDTGHDNTDWIVGYRRTANDRPVGKLVCPAPTDLQQQQYVAGFFDKDSGTSPSRFGTTFWFDHIQVEVPQPPPDDDEEDEEAEPPEPVFVWAQRSRETSILVELQLRQALDGSVFNTADPALGGTFRGQYRRDWAEARTSGVGGTWYDGILPRNMEMHVDPQGGFFITDMGQCGCNYTGVVERIERFPYNLYRFILDSASCLAPTEENADARIEHIALGRPARGLATVKPARGNERARLIAIAVSMSADRIFAFDLERSTDE